MFKRKVLLVALALALVLGLASGAFAVEDVTAGHSIEFKDMPEEGFWSYPALSAAVENGLLDGFEEGGARYIKPEASLTRAQMATIVNRAFGAQAAAALTGVTDVPSYTWYAPEMQKAVQMGTFMLDTKMRPNDSITRQEAFVVLARAFKLQDADKAYKPLNAFSDKADIADWAKPNLSAMAGAGYIQGSGGYLQPKASITRAEFATVMDNMVKQYIDVAGTYTEVVADGNVIIRVPGVTLDGVKVKGDLVIGDGVGEGDAILKNITVTGRALIRGGGENSVKFIGSETDVQNIVIARGSDGKVRILTEDGAVLAEAEVDSDGDVILEGTFGSVTVLADDITVTAVGATLTDVAVDGQNSHGHFRLTGSNGAEREHQRRSVPRRGRRGCVGENCGNLRA
ncbi:MAG: S-layer homology domain-containing protein [Anaerovoracaceae bacterium]